MNKETNTRIKDEWEDSFDKVWEEAHNVTGFSEIMNRHPVRKFIRKLLKSQKEELVEKIEKTPTSYQFDGYRMFKKQDIINLIKEE